MAGSCSSSYAHKRLGSALPKAAASQPGRRFWLPYRGGSQRGLGGDGGPSACPLTEEGTPG